MAPKGKVPGRGKAATPSKAGQTPAKRKQEKPPSLQYESTPAVPRLGPCELLPQRPQVEFQQGQDLVFMVVDVAEEGGGGRFALWGATPEGASVLVHVGDFRPYLYIAAPKKEVLQDDGSLGEAAHPTDQHSLEELRTLLNRYVPPDCRVVEVQPVHRRPIMFYRPQAPEGETYLRLLFSPGVNVRKAGTNLGGALSSGRLRSAGLGWRDLSVYEGEVNTLQRFLADVPVSGGAWVFLPAAPGLHPASPQPAARPPAPPGAARAAGPPSAAQRALQAQQLGYQLVPPEARVSSCDIEVTAPWQAIHCLTPDATQLADPHWTPFSGDEGRPGGRSPGEVSEGVQRAAGAARRGDIAPLRLAVLDVLCGTWDGADRVAVPSQDPVLAVSCTVTTFRAAGHSAEGAGGTARGPAVPAAPAVPAVEEEGEDEGDGVEAGDDLDDVELLEAGPAAPAGAAGAAGPAAAGAEQAQQEQRVSMVFLLARDGAAPAAPAAGPGSSHRGDTGLTSSGRGGGGSASAALASPRAPGPSTPLAGGGRAGRLRTAREGGEGGGPGVSASCKAGPSGGEAGPSSTAGAEGLRERMEKRLSGAHVEVFQREDELLLSALEFLRAADPDVLALFQVGDTLNVLQQRCDALGLWGASLNLSRLRHPDPRNPTALTIKKVTMYSAAWVRSQSRMSSTSNQETYRAEIPGRVVIDVLRQVLTAQNLASFSLVDCTQSILGQTLEVLRPCTLSSLAGLAPSPPTPAATSPTPLHAAVAAAAAAPPTNGLGTMPAEAGALRMARHAMRRVGVVEALLHRLATIPEAIEMARATGLTIGQTQYNAQMIRTHSLLLRTAWRTGYLLAGRQDSLPLSEHTFIMHPVEQGTVGLYRKEPVAILDFASLYPSIYRAYNLCYTTLLHKDDQSLFSPDQLTVTPTGAVFVKPEVRPGLLPSILSALVSARSATRAQLKEASDPAARAVLDSRQKALKVTANALYGFTGAQASPLQCVPLADSCLAYGAQSCRTALEALAAAEAAGRLGPHGRGARAIYGHTDSIFVLFPNAKGPAEGIQAGKLASREVSAAFPPPMELKFERVCQPLLLLHVNRYAGHAFEREEEAAAPGGGTLIVKGLKSMWRQAAPIVRTTLHGALERILMRDDVRGAVEFVEGEVRRLLTGRVGLSELAMTGGLWRVTGEQVERAAAEGGGGPSEEEVKGPHASLAVRLTQRDPGRSFVLGERLQYVLLSGHKLQDDAAEDPLTAARAGSPPDLELYWRNKLQRPLAEIFGQCLPKEQLQSLMGGAHTLVRVEQLAPQQTATPLSPGRGKAASKGRQTGLAMFFQQTAKCLGCRRSMPGFKGPIDEAPGLCEDCTRVEGRWEEAYLGLLAEQSLQEARQAAALAACRQCDSGTSAQPHLCANGECAVLFKVLGARARLGAQQRALARMDLSW